MNKIYLIALFPFLGFIADLDCNSSFSCRPTKSQEVNDYSLVLSLEEGTADNYEFELYDLTTGDFVEKKSAYFRSGMNREVFRGVKPSTYVIYFSTTQCNQKKSISGKGIILQ
jgi:hypothetical protein